MTNKQLREELLQYPDDMLVKHLYHNNVNKYTVLTMEGILETSDTDVYDEDNDKVIKGNTERYILLNPIIQ